MTAMPNVTPPFQVLLSYGRPDALIVKSFYRTLLASGVTVWIDVENIRGGEDWQAATKKAIRRSQLVLIFLSKNVVSREGYLQAEILDALEIARRKPPEEVFLIPVRLDDGPIHPRLEQFHCVSFFAPNAIPRLIRQIAECRQTFLKSRMAENLADSRPGDRLST
jgi:hypothetical protein